MHRRGVATFPDGLPFPRDAIRLVWGEGVRAGLYALTPTECYWYTCFNAPEDAAAPSTVEQRFEEAVAPVRGWAWNIEQAVRNTPPEGLSR